MNVHLPFAEDLEIGVPLEAAPDITIDSGLAAQYLSITGDQLRLALSDPLSSRVTGREARLANPGLVITLSIGQSTVATRRVIANLMYHNLTLRRPVHVGETIRTIVTPVEAAWTRTGRDRAKVLLSMQVSTDDGDDIATYQRLALLPVREAERLVVSEPAAPEPEPRLVSFGSCVPDTWQNPPSAGSRGLTAGDQIDDPLADTVSSARELVRLSQNLAAAHRDARSGLEGRRLVYGGHTVALAQASLSRVLPQLLTVLAWRSCDHVSPVFEDDLLSFTTSVDAVDEIRGFQLADLTVVATALRSGAEPVEVLRWRPVAVVSGVGSS